MNAARLGAAGALAALAAVHAVWAAGSSWPARSPRALALAVLGSDRLPGGAPTASVAVALAAASVVAVRAPTSSPPRRLLAAAFTLRAAMPGRAFDLIRTPHPASGFARWNARCFRPLAAAIAVLLGLG